jgi:lysophospholipase L1-like esterase
MRLLVHGKCRVFGNLLSETLRKQIRPTHRDSAASFSPEVRAFSFWHTLADDMKPLDVINRGFGGSQIAQVNHYVARSLINYRPRAVVLYAGENDLSWPWSKSPETVFSDFRRFVETIHSQLPGTWVYYISMKPTPLRWSNWRTVQKTNKMIEDYSRSQERVQFIDVSTAMLDAQGKPRHELFRWDGLHIIDCP